MKLQVNHLFYKYIKNAKRCFFEVIGQALAMKSLGFVK